jgi:hypothetical protein
MVFLHIISQQPLNRDDFDMCSMVGRDLFEQFHPLFKWKDALFVNINGYPNVQLITNVTGPVDDV